MVDRKANLLPTYFTVACRRTLYNTQLEGSVKLEGMRRKRGAESPHMPPQMLNN